ncbi:Hypothetical protein GbCGDNIH9_7232 [Granulibacter bethesdensis]|uniref:Uncharacterized protein n=1 Tax=Granulibacter bethesdensis TaxID=364410 RepID=A0AAC9KE17_9PROT|nr:Hypothetical protein GbCGDNIH9_7232 [Granulibacter bethesdensis]APH63018.1 Hypothetical protein GbCGDNIH8_7232 [Granulibacter bethesdensis]
MAGTVPCASHHKIITGTKQPGNADYRVDHVARCHISWPRFLPA